jgi:DHA1 family bicyclomycin/chloramphenicol resistance-like MFS transporter
MKPALPRLGEFVALVAMLSSLTALSTDAMLPALQTIGHDLHVAQENNAQFIISALFLGLGCGQVFFGPISDAVGRKPLMYVGLVMFMLGSLLAVVAQDFNHMLIGRFLQGLGAAAPRVLTLALVRDCYSGRAMAQIMSFTMSVFILVPMLAPSLGQGILHFADWRGIFGMLVLLAVVVLVWFGLRMPETLHAENRRSLTWEHFFSSARQVLSNRTAMRYTIITGVVFGAFTSYLNSVQQILQIQYGLGDQFPLYFAFLALGIGMASFINAKLVMRFGMHWLAKRAAISFSVLSCGFLVVAWQTAGHPPLLALMAFFLLAFLSLGLLFGNLNALAMEPLGHVAGIGASVVGSLSTLIAIPLGGYIGHAYDNSVLPLIMGFSVFGVIATGLIFVKDNPTNNP